MSPSAKAVVRFLASKSRNEWLSTPEMEVFVRRSKRCHPISQRAIKCFDIANVTVNNREQGVFTSWLGELQKIVLDAKFDAIFVESIMTERFEQYFIKRGWYRVPGIDRNFLLML